MEDWEKESQKDMLEVDRILGKFWREGFMSSQTRQKIWDEFPARLKTIIHQK